MSRRTRLSLKGDFSPWQFKATSLPTSSDFSELLTKANVQLQILADTICCMRELHDRFLAQQERPVATSNSLRLSKEPRKRLSTVFGVGVRPSASLAQVSGDMGFACDSLLDVCCTGSLKEMRELLSDSADPNMAFGSCTCMGLEFLSGTPLALAVLRGKPQLVKELAAAKANPDSEYSFYAGAEQVVWRGSAAHATIPGDNLDLLRELAHLGANLHSKGSNGASLVWQAAYFGKTDILAYLMEQGVSIEDPATSQDDVELSYTPLHVAAKTGNSAVVRLLLKAKANIQVDNGRDKTPLEDAILNGQAAVVEQLVASKAELFQVHVRRTRQTVRQSVFDDIALPAVPVRCLDLVFDSHNPALIAAVAQGLKAAPSLLDGLCTRDLVQFLSSHGDAPLHILHAIFQPYALNYWDVSQNKKRRMKRVAAHIRSPEMMNVADGPHHKTIAKSFLRKEATPKYIADFIADLAPEEPSSAPSIYLPATFFMCHIPCVHQDLNVLRALADCKQDDVFNEQGCQAIVDLKWRLSARVGTYCLIVVSIAEVLVLEVIAFATGDADSRLAGLLMPVSIAAAVTWFLDLFLELARALGYMSCGFLGRYLTVKGQWLFSVTMPLGGFVIVAVLVTGHNVHATLDYGYSLVMGLVIFAAWMRVLYAMEPVEAVGLRVLPITTTMQEAGPFCIVLMFYLLASTSMYFMLGIYNFADSFFILYRLVVLNDLDLFEMENTWAPRLKLPVLNVSRPSQIEIEQISPERTTLYWPVRIIMLVFSFVIGILLMNMFIAILCRSYVQASERSRLAFLRCRAGKVLDQHAMQLGIQILCCCRRRRRISMGCRASMLTANDLSVADEPSAKAFIWYCRPREAQ